jgi:hypothetical protein
MDTSRSRLLGEIASDASLERSDYMAQASAQLREFLETNGNKIEQVGGLVLIDDEADYLAVAADLTFRSRSRYLDEATGKWVTENEVIENPSELVELYNLADVFGAFADVAKVGAGSEEEEGEEEEGEGEAEATPSAVGLADNPYAAVADDWAAAGRDYEEAPETEEEAAERLYDLALAFQERSQQTEAHLLEQFETAASRLTSVLGDLVIVDDEDERLTLKATGSFAGEVVPEDDAELGIWRKLESPDELVEFYDPTDVFGDLADTLAEAFPSLGEPPSGDEGDESGEDEAEDEGEAETEPDGETDGDAETEDGEGDKPQ